MWHLRCSIRGIICSVLLTHSTSGTHTRSTSASHGNTSARKSSALNALNGPKLDETEVVSGCESSPCLGSPGNPERTAQERSRQEWTQNNRVPSYVRHDPACMETPMHFASSEQLSTLLLTLSSPPTSVPVQTMRQPYPPRSRASRYPNMEASGPNNIATMALRTLYHDV